MNQLFSAEELLPKCYDYARNLLRSVSPNSLRQTRWQIYRDLHRDVATSVADSEKLINEMAKEEDFREGVAALVEKRSPDWPSAK